MAYYKHNPDFVQELKDNNLYFILENKIDWNDICLNKRTTVDTSLLKTPIDTDGIRNILLSDICDCESGSLDYYKYKESSISITSYLDTSDKYVIHQGHLFDKNSNFINNKSAIPYGYLWKDRYITEKVRNLIMEETNKLLKFIHIVNKYYTTLILVPFVYKGDNESVIKEYSEIKEYLTDFSTFMTYIDKYNFRAIDCISCTIQIFVFNKIEKATA